MMAQTFAILFLLVGGRATVADPACRKVQPLQPLGQRQWLVGSAVEDTETGRLSLIIGSQPATRWRADRQRRQLQQATSRTTTAAAAAAPLQLSSHWAADANGSGGGQAGTAAADLCNLLVRPFFTTDNDTVAAATVAADHDSRNWTLIQDCPAAGDRRPTATVAAVGSGIVFCHKRSMARCALLCHARATHNHAVCLCVCC